MTHWILPVLWALIEIRDRGIDVVRNKIKAFAQKKVTLPPGRHKIVILDEADRQFFISFLFFSNFDGGDWVA